MRASSGVRIRRMMRKKMWSKALAQTPLAALG